MVSDGGMTSPALQDIVALLGCPAAGNPAQYLFERAFAPASIDWRFLTVDVSQEHLAMALGGVLAMGFRGCLLSAAHEVAAAPLVGSLSPAATFAGAVSLVERQANGLVGHMTDGRGIAEALRSHTPLTGARVLIAGAGPGGRAAALELALSGVAEIVVADRSAEAALALVEALRGLETAAEFSVLPTDAALEVPQRVGIVISVPGLPGTWPAFAGLRSDLVVADTALVEQPSAVVTAARKAGACVIDGLEIHVAKTAIDFLVLTGMETDPDMLREALEEFLSA